MRSSFGSNNTSRQPGNIAPLCRTDIRLKGKLSGVITQKQKNKKFFLRVCFSWANSRSGTQTTTAVTVNRVQGAGAASQPTGLMADCVGRRVSALSYHNTVWHTWTTVTSVNTHRLPHCLAGRQIMRPVFALDVWFNVPLFVIGFRPRERKCD